MRDLPIAAAPQPPAPGARTETRTVLAHGGHWPALDGLRAIAVLAVLGVHVEVLPGGFLGVDVFFVLSGFLITSLLLREWDRRGAVSFRAFYIRRSLRLLPALGCVIGVSILTAWLLESAGGRVGQVVGQATFGLIPWVAGFAANWACALGFTYLVGLLAPTWSLSVEEQFYLMWPAVAVLALRRGWDRRRIAVSLSVLAATAMGWRSALAVYGSNRIYFGTDTHCDGLLAGCAIAFWLASGQGVPSWLARGGAWLGAAVLLVLFVTGNRYTPAAPLQITVAVLASAALVTAIAAGRLPRALHRLLCAGWPQRIGRRSYGLYLWQYPILIPAMTLAAHYAVGLPADERRLVIAAPFSLGAIACFAAAEASYRFVESPALRAMRRFRS